MPKAKIINLFFLLLALALLLGLGLRPSRWVDVSSAQSEPIIDKVKLAPLTGQELLANMLAAYKKHNFYRTEGSARQWSPLLEGYRQVPSYPDSTTPFSYYYIRQPETLYLEWIETWPAKGKVWPADGEKVKATLQSTGNKASLYRPHLGYSEEPLTDAVDLIFAYSGVTHLALNLLFGEATQTTRLYSWMKSISQPHIEQLGERECYVLEGVITDQGPAHSSTKVWLGKDDFLIWKVEEKAVFPETKEVVMREEVYHNIIFN